MRLLGFRGVNKRFIINEGGGLLTCNTLNIRPCAHIFSTKFTDIQLFILYKTGDLSPINNEFYTRNTIGLTISDFSFLKTGSDYRVVYDSVSNPLQASKER